MTKPSLPARASFALALALTSLWALAATPARAQTANCDFDAGLVDLFVNLRFENFIDCPAGSGVPCTQGPDEEDLVGWGVSLAAGPGTSGDLGVTNLTGDAAWTGNGGLTNTCVDHGQHTITLTLPSPNPYSPEANWPSNLTFNFTINPTDAQTGQPVERFFLTVFFGCSCDPDGEPCTEDTCQNGLCLYPQVAHDPTQPELCNDLDDDCDGDIDEGLPPDAPECLDPSFIGCADGTREGFMTWEDFPLIASCGGAWTTSGVDADPTCARAAGNHGTSQTGTGCSAADLCPAGWHVCYGPDDIAQRLGNGDCTDAVDPFYPNFGSADPAAEVSVPPGGAFFASAARAAADTCEDGVNAGATSGAAIYGCGNMGADPGANDCGFFDRVAGALCGGLRDVEAVLADDPATDYGYALSAEWAWSCGSTAGNELASLRKVFPDRQGGVLCCKDSDPSLTEVCDGIDNDADGQTDELAFGGGPVIVVGETCNRGADCGTLECAPNGDFACVGSRPCADTTCDGVDDDGDGDTDEEYEPTATSCGQGVCAATGTLSCIAGDEVDSCSPAAQDEAADLTCDGLDGDCDGETDEDFAAAATTCGLGACAATGTLTCQDGAPTDSCAPGAPLAADDATCDGTDDDCDGEADEDVPTTQTTCGLGACAATGTLGCQAGELVDSCTPGTPAATDQTCDNVDDDCDGEADDDFVMTPTSCGVGACAGTTGTLTCVDGVSSDSCDPLEGAVTETCDGSDDDCDGETDEGFDVGESCDGDDADQCATGTIACDGEGAAVCDETGEGEVETCNGQDDDCDGQTDEGIEGCGDRDEDTIPDLLDNCVDIPNTDQADSDGDGDGDACDVVAQGGACQGGGLAHTLPIILISLIFFARLARTRRS